MKIAELLRRNNLLTDEMKMVDYHMNLLKCDVNYFIKNVPELKDKSKEEVIKYIVDAFNKCDANKEDYDFKIDATMTSIGLKTNDYSKFSNFKNQAVYETRDDGWEFGDQLTSIVDNNVDFQNDVSTRS